jgi:hypothetical protein
MKHTYRAEASYPAQQLQQLEQVGRKDIALFLILSGARMDIFHAAMLGRLDIVKPMLNAFPNLAASKGPHGITLLAHAQKGGEDAVAVVRFLESLSQSA